MARKRRSNPKKQRALHPEDVLAGRVEIQAAALFDLIHEVNPTHRGLSAPEAARRYETKSRLQSLLIRRFGDEHVEVEPTGQDGVVSLAHRSGTKDACHAVVSELEPDARSWLWRRLDLAASPADPEADRSRPDGGGASAKSQDDLSAAGVAELLRIARQAVDDYDYEAAEAHLTLAFERGKGRLDAALALLDLWVGVLGMDQQALELEPRLSPQASTDAELRTYLALAAARVGETERALELARGTVLPRTAEVYAVLADQAVRGRDREAASRYLEQVSRYETTHPEIPRLTAAVEKLRVEDLRGPEAELERRYREAGAFAVEDEARSVAGRWPESELARRILREVAALRREAEVAEHLGTAEKAAAEERFDDAARHYQAALDAGCGRPDLPALIAEARDRERRRQEQAQVDAVVDLFERPSRDLRSALLGHLALPENLRAQVRERVREPALGWLDQLDPPRSVAKGQAAVAALLALGEAIEALDRGEPRPALELLEPHRELLRGVEEAGRCLRTARSRWDAERRERAVRALDAARKAWDEEQVRRARELLEAIDPEDLGAAGRARLEDLLASIRSAETVEQLEHEYERHLAAEDYLGALDRARELEERTPEPALWEERRHEIHRRLRTAWCFDVSRDPTPLAEVHEFWHSGSGPQASIWLDDDCRKLVLPDAWGGWLFLRVVDVESRTVVERVSLRTPEPLAHPLAVAWERDRIRVAGSQGLVLDLRPRDWQVLGWHPLRDVLPHDRISETVKLVPGSDYVWLGVNKAPEGNGPRPREEKTYAVDLKARRISRRLPVSWCDMLAVLGPGEPRMAISMPESGVRYTPETTLRICTPRGTEAAELRPKGALASVAVGPRNEGLLLLLNVPSQDYWAAEDDEYDDDTEDEDVVLLHLEEPFPTGAFDTGTGFEIPDASASRVHTVATSLDQGLVFLLATDSDVERDLLAMAMPQGSLELLYRSAVPYDTLLVQDRHARRVVAVPMGESSPRIVELGPGEPEPFPRRVPRRSGELHAFTRFHTTFCHRTTGEPNAGVRLRISMLEGISSVDMRRFSRNFEADHRDDADARCEMCLALRQAGMDKAELGQLTRLLVKDHPRHAGAALLMADLEANDGRWEDVLQRLEALDVTDLDDGRACHHHHLLGLSLLYLRRPEEALETFETGSGHERGICPLDSLIDLARALSDPLEAGGWDAGQPTIRQLVGAIRRADEALASGDAAAARDALERPSIWSAQERQSAARLAAAFLELESATPNERFLKRHALAFYCHVARPDKPDLLDVVLPGMSWDEDRLIELGLRARAWLGDGPGDRSSTRE